MADNNEIIYEHTKDIATLKTKVDKLEDNIICLNRIDKSIEKLSWLMEEQVKGNDKRDGLLNKMSESLDSLNSEIKCTNTRIDGLEGQFMSSEQKNYIDVRDINKEEVKLTLGQKAKKMVFPIGAIAGIITFIYEVVKNIKIGQ